jgi:hypothetical protein
MPKFSSAAWKYPTYEAMLSDFEERRIGDGLPVVPATQEAVARFVAASGLDASHVVGDLPPTWGEATIEKIAVNAVMAGCRPEYMPVLVTAIEAMLEQPFNLYGLQATTHPAAPLVLVSGPRAGELGVNAGVGAFGPGFRANASIGRAVRLILINLGGARPGIGDQATQGQPAKYAFCVAENDAESPWEPLRVARGAAADDTVVIVAALENPQNINDHGSYTAEQVLTTIAGSMTSAGSNSNYLGVSDLFVFLCPEHAEVIAARGFSRRDVQEYLFEKARVRVETIGEGQRAHLRHRHRINPRYEELGLADTNRAEWPVMTRPEDLNIVVVGGAGKHSAFSAPTGTISRSVMRKMPA